MVNGSPFDFFLPSPSLSITSSFHCTDRPVELWPPRNRRMAAGGCVWVCVWVWVRFGGARWAWEDGFPAGTWRWAKDAIVRG